MCPGPLISIDRFRAVCCRHRHNYESGVFRKSRNTGNAWVGENASLCEAICDNLQKVFWQKHLRLQRYFSCVTGAKGRGRSIR
jgi:hypothetical protein